MARAALVFRDPYKRPYGLELPINTQIPSDQQREHRVPIKVAAGTVDCELHYKLYYPIEDNHPDLARQLESKKLAFANVTPSEKAIESEPEVKVVTPEGISPEIASPAELVDFARPKIGTVKVDIPTGNSDADIQKLVELFQFPVPQANGEARKRLIEIGLPVVPRVIEALGSWDNKTFNQAMAVLEALGDKSAPALVKALDHGQLYVRIHARELLGRMAYKGSAAGKQSEVLPGARQGARAAGGPRPRERPAGARRARLRRRRGPDRGAARRFGPRRRARGGAGTRQARRPRGGAGARPRAPRGDGVRRDAARRRAGAREAREPRGHH
jgi:hypothetical protein